MDGLSSQTNLKAAEYHPMRNCESDDSQSYASKYDENDGIPGIIYTSDDSADVGQSDATYIDSDAPNYIAQNVNQGLDDEFSQQFLLISGSPQPLPQVNDSFINHPLSPMNLSAQNKNQLYADHPKVPGEGMGLTRCNSTSSSSTEPELNVEAPFLSVYEQLSSYGDDEGYTGGLNFDSLNDDPIKTQVIHEQLNMLTGNKDSNKMGQPDRFYVDDVHIDAAYRDAFYVKWNWAKIRQTCVFLNFSFLIGLLCMGVGLLIKMPMGSDCNPVQEWWQGSVTYYIFVPSFYDTDGNGVGDIKGVISKLDYIEQLGVKTVRISPLLESEEIIRDKILPSNYSNSREVFGSEDDLRLLAALLHERNMFITLDISLYEVGKLGMYPDEPVAISFDLLNNISNIIEKWTDLGVDGFVFTDIDQVPLTEHELITAFQQWRNIANKKNRRLNRRTLMVPLNLIKKLDEKKSNNLQQLLQLVNLIDAHLKINESSAAVAQFINDVTRWDDQTSLPWINWNMGGVRHKRLSEQLAYTEGLASDYYEDESLSTPTLGSTLFQLFLPGSITIYYGDEIYAPSVNIGPYNKEVDWASLMIWSPSPPWGGFSETLPWLPLRSDWQMMNVALLNNSIESLRTMIKVRQQMVPLYINGIFGDVGDYHPRKSTNYRIRYASDNLLVLERYYPRHNKYAIMINLGEETKEKDFSKLYYGGNVLASSHSKEGYIRFTHLELEPGEAIACVLDK